VRHLLPVRDTYLNMSQWEYRVHAMSSYIVPYGGVTRILDLGAGDHSLRKYLHGYIQYLPVDKVKFASAEGDTTVCDLNESPEILLRAGRVHYAFLSGVLEYISDVDRLMSVVGSMADNIILSYNVAKSHDADQILRRREQGWVNDMSTDDLISTIRQWHYEIDTVGFIIPGNIDEVVISASAPGVWWKCWSPGCIMRVPIEEWRFMYDTESWAEFKSRDPGAAE
jgi:hypothetical protein